MENLLDALLDVVDSRWFRVSWRVITEVFFAGMLFVLVLVAIAVVTGRITIPSEDVPYLIGGICFGLGLGLGRMLWRHRARGR